MNSRIFRFFTTNRGFLPDLWLRARLVLRLVRDPRVPQLAKLLPIGAFAYLLIPDLVPFLIDDAIAIWIGTVLFFKFCPPSVVEEHKRALMASQARA